MENFITGYAANEQAHRTAMRNVLGDGSAFGVRLRYVEEPTPMGTGGALKYAESLLDEAIALATQIAANSPGGIKLSKRALQANMEITSYAAALELENRGQALLTRGADMPEALRAFKEKREPSFTGN